MGLIVLASPAFRPANATAQEEGTPIEAPTPAFELASQSMWIADEDVFRVSLRLVDAPDEATVDINIGLPIRSRSALLDRLAEPSTGLGLQQTVRLPISAPDANGITSLQIATISSQEPEVDTPGQPRLKSLRRRGVPRKPHSSGFGRLEIGHNKHLPGPHPSA
ncbi:MAG: hypothetical protein F4015_07050 [Acidimicrobiia bacterium]|nr:hypothetical protein [Acidimicrobiia bacterium]